MIAPAPPVVLWITPPTAPLDPWLEGLAQGPPEPSPKSHRHQIAVLLRRPGIGDDAHLQLAHLLRRRTRAMGLRLLLRRIDLALLVDADGVHLPERGIPPQEARRLLSNRLVGASRHSEGGLQDAFQHGADYCTLSPLFPSPGKGTALGAPAFSAWTRGQGPTLALGGVCDLEAVAQAARAGAAGVATIRGIRTTAEALQVRAHFLSHRNPPGNGDESPPRS